MKVGEFKRFDKYCGIACVEYESKVWYLVYNFTMTISLIDEGELGKCIGKGETEIESMRDAITNIARNFRKVDKKLEKMSENIRSVLMSGGEMDDQIVFPMPKECLEYYPDGGGRFYYHETEKANANVSFNKEEGIILHNF